MPNWTGEWRLSNGRRTSRRICTEQRHQWDALSSGQTVINVSILASKDHLWVADRTFTVHKWQCRVGNKCVLFIAERRSIWTVAAPIHLFIHLTNKWKLKLQSSTIILGKRRLLSVFCCVIFVINLCLFITAEQKLLNKSIKLYSHG